MVNQVLRILDELKAALGAGDVERALDRLQALRDVYTTRAAEERPRLERAKRLIRDNLGDEPDVVMAFLEEATTIQLNRVGALLAVQTSLTYPRETEEDPSELVTTLETRERALSKATTAVEDQLTGISLPALLFLRAVETPTLPIGKGATTDVTATVLNVGDRTATGVSAAVSVDAGLTVINGPDGLDDIEAGGSTTFSVALRADAAGEHTVTVEVTGDPERGAIESGQLEALSKGGFIERAAQQVDQLRTRVDEASPPSGGHERQLLAKLDAAADSLAAAAEHVEEDEPEAANHRLNTARRQIGAFINALEADRSSKNNDRVPKRLRIGLKVAAEDTIELLSRAREAGI